MLHLFAGQRGPVTVIRSFDARPEARERALMSFEAQDILRALLGDAARHELVGVAELVGDFGRAGEASSNDLVEQVARAIDEGMLIVVPGWERSGPSYAAPPPERRDEPPFLPPERAPSSQEQKTWFAVRVIDEIGDPVAGIELLFDVDGEERKVVTGSDGRARVDDARQARGAARFASTQQVRSMLDERWTRAREKDWKEAPPDAVVFEVSRGKELRRFELEGERQKTIVLKPPYRVRLLDHDGKALGGRECSIDVGSQKHRDTSDGQGWIEFPVGQACPEHATVAWEEQRGSRKVKRRLVVALACHDGQPNSVAKARLGNLGYPVEDDLEHAVTAFQFDQDLPIDPPSGDDIPATTRDEIERAWREAHG